MRVFFSLVALVAGAQALSNPLNQKRGGGSDVCSSSGCSLSFDNPVTGKTTNFGNYDQCTCLSQVNSVVKSNSMLSTAASIFGNNKVSDYISNHVRTSGSTCNYPDHSTPACSSGNPCGFECCDGYSSHGGSCACLPPYSDCGGVCGYFPHCPSKSAKKRDADEWKKSAHCDSGYTACGVLWSSKINKVAAYECVDAKNDLESCGGCSIPLHRGSPLGTDCTSLPGVADVSCMNGSCYVHRCMPGYQLSTDNSMCMDEETVKKFTTIAEYGWKIFAPL
ncbi:hypothetical protein BJ322DRAFT_664639 [Thelephora terrestris]|uniref:Protein CPL1-like domain-containing protein n=1 Tax=Thelephora terrestris TaxID=56493 RepID=A0A9P6HH29_9AGAM|nr:hypothetical protein BJ322DRAFT_664639 [Thelephora terrestris]